jgi:hypothetical protein
MKRLVPALGPALGLGATLFVAACGGGGEPPGAAFKPLSFSYLTPLRLNVGQIRVEDHVPPPAGPADLGPGAPVPPDQALRQMAQDRLVAAGNSGTAIFSIDQASITGQPGGALDGAMAVHLDITSNSGGHAGYAEAHVSRQFTPGSDTENVAPQAQLYNLTSQMMQDMNVEFEFQLRRTLGDWMVDASGAPVAAQVEQQPLTSSGAAPEASSPQTPISVGAPVQLAPPAGAVPAGAVQTPMQAPTTSGSVPPDPASVGPGSVDPAVDPTARAPMQLSPPPGVLRPPPGAMPLAPPATPQDPAQGALQAPPPGTIGPDATPSGF